MDEELKILNKINNKLDQIIVLFKFSLSDKIDKYIKEIENDKVSKKILEIADGSLSYTELKDKVSELIGVHEITVRRRISELSRKGLIVGQKNGREVYYTSIDIFR